MVCLGGSQIPINVQWSERTVPHCEVAGIRAAQFRLPNRSALSTAAALTSGVEDRLCIPTGAAYRNAHADFHDSVLGPYLGVIAKGSVSCRAGHARHDLWRPWRVPVNGYHVGRRIFVANSCSMLIAVQPNALVVDTRRQKPYNGLV